MHPNDSTALVIDSFTRGVTVIESYCGEIRLAHATGFFWRHDEQPYLVSNWHVFSGRNAITGQPTHPSGACPDTIEFRAHVLKENGISNYMHSRLRIVVDGVNRWLQHPVHGQAIDVAAISIGRRGDFGNAVMLNDLEQKMDMKISVGLDVFILGYPLPPEITARLPIWKRGTIASEPNFRISGLPKLLVDSSVRPGMSGAPVIARSVGTYVREDNNMTFWGEEANRIVGVYSGRLGGEHAEQTQLGAIWRIETVDEVCGGNTPGDFALAS